MKKSIDLRENLLLDEKHDKQNNRMSLRRPTSTSHSSSSSSISSNKQKKKDVTLTDTEREILQTRLKTSTSPQPQMLPSPSLSSSSSSSSSPYTPSSASASSSLMYQQPPASAYSDAQLLLEMNKMESTLPENSAERQRNFREVEQYGWDFVIILPNPDMGDPSSSGNRSPNKSNTKDGTVSYGQLTAILRRGGLQSYSYYSSTNEYVIVKTRAGVNRLEQQAELMGYKLLLDEKKLRTAANGGVKHDDVRRGYRIKPIHINEDRVYSKLKP